FEAEQMLKFLQDIKGPLIVVGDFNDEPSGTAYKLMLTGFEDAWLHGGEKEVGLSYPADNPTKRIDYIFTRRTDRVPAKKAWVVNTLASDHIPVVAELEIR
ncbi:MAG: endonuclease/exonuclease/phosphatase family protein, partial [Acidobacteriota bacterium]|nr:endonuclease/exonuclease/phosphatase family protein [Acidobacteriota bacterium]